ncbi:MAG: N-acetyltransferase family protein [Halolamina sp.]
MTDDADDADEPTPDAPAEVTVRPYDPARDAAGLWACKRGFEEGLGTGTGDDQKAATYAAKLTPDYRDRWLDWVDRCVAEDGRCVTVAVDADVDPEPEPKSKSEPESDADTDATTTPTRDAVPAEPEPGHVVGYAFVLPERMAYVWDAAVLNEIFVVPAARGTGVADDLMDAAVALARDQTLPLDRLVLDVDRENDRAKAFYERHGFAHWGEMVARDL